MPTCSFCREVAVYYCEVSKPGDRLYFCHRHAKQHEEEERCGGKLVELPATDTA